MSRIPNQTNHRQIHLRLSMVAKSLAKKHDEKLESLKAEQDQIKRPDFLWYYLLQSFATMGQAAGWHRLPWR